MLQYQKFFFASSEIEGNEFISFTLLFFFSSLLTTENKLRAKHKFFLPCMSRVEVNLLLLAFLVLWRSQEDAQLYRWINIKLKLLTTKQMWGKLSPTGIRIFLQTRDYHIKYSSHARFYMSSFERWWDEKMLIKSSSYVALLCISLQQPLHVYVFFFWKPLWW